MKLLDIKNTPGAHYPPCLITQLSPTGLVADAVEIGVVPNVQSVSISATTGGTLFNGGAAGYQHLIVRPGSRVQVDHSHRSPAEGTPPSYWITVREGRN